MPTVLEFAKEVRHRLVSRDTGCLAVEFPDDTVTISFSDGSVASEKPVFLSCFGRTPIDFQFRAMEVQNPGETGHGASLLIEAIEMIDKISLVRAWEPYAEWKIAFRTDPSIHNTLVKDHLANSGEPLRRMMRLAVSGSMTLEPPKLPFTDEIGKIEKAYETCNWHQVLGVDEDAGETQIKQAYRKLARRFHPDRWARSRNMQLRDRIEKTFQRVSRAYRELKHPHTVTPLFLAEPPARKSVWTRMKSFARQNIARNLAEKM